MRAPLSWLRELVPLHVEATDEAALAELASELDASGLVVEAIEPVGQGLDEVVVARVEEISAIEGADRIRRVVVDAGSGSLEVVCGAWNFSEGDTVVLAPVGAELPGGFKIAKRKLRGVTSNGMLCSGRELGLSDDHEGILVLSRTRDATLGTPLAEELGLSRDVVFELDVEPNRPDCLSILGIARDLAARYGLPLTIDDPVLPESDPSAAELATLEIDAPELCGHLVARVLTGVVSVPSPFVVQHRLRLVGMRPINSVVDASNYVMFELGQPTHPYDLGRLGGQGIKVRAAHPGETLVTLDGETRILGGRRARPDEPESALDAIICDANDLPVGIAGVMGGHSSEIDEETTSVLLEVAQFDAAAVGRTARHIGLRSEASIRFERGVDSGGLERAAARFCELVVEAASKAGAPAPVVARGVVEAGIKPARLAVSVRPARLNALLGTELAPKQMESLLSPLGFEVAPQDDEQLSVVAPSWRPDVAIEADVAEEVARAYGYMKIPRTNRRSPFVGGLSPRQATRRSLKRVLAGLSAHEAWTGTLADPREQQAAGVSRPLVGVANPMASEESVLRGGMLAGLLKALHHNASHRHPYLRLFEIGDVFSKSEAGAPIEKERIAVLFGFENDSARQAVAGWRVVADALCLSGVEILQRDELDADYEDDYAAELVEAPLAPRLEGLHPARSGLLVMEDRADEDDRRLLGVLGALGEVDPAVLDRFGLPGRRVGYLELDGELLQRVVARLLSAEPVSRYPSSDIDLAFVLPESVPAGRLEEAIRLGAGELCETVELFDVYRREDEPGERSLAYHVRLGALDHTLDEEEVRAARGRCIEAVVASLPATLRA